MLNQHFLPYLGLIISEKCMVTPISFLDFNSPRYE